MTRFWYGTILVLATVVIASSQLDDGGMGCEISSGLGMADDLNYTLSAVKTCDVGTISWHYPMGTLSVNFPRSIYSESMRARQKLKVCFRGDIGEGVSYITQKIVRKNRIATHRIPLVDSKTDWQCSRPSRDPEGISVTLVSQSKQSPEFYLKVIKYKAVVTVKLGKGGGNRRGKGHGGKGGNRGRGQRKGDRKRYRSNTRRGGNLLTMSENE